MGGNHSACHESDCRCACHPKVQEMIREDAQKPKVTVSPSSLVCPRCSQKPRVGDTYCRLDGEMLVTPKKCECGQIGDRADRFCGRCGRKFGPAPGEVPELSEEEIAALEEKARTRPSDVEVAPVEVR
jgi:hypothetical protein